MPGVLIIEALAQTAAVLVLHEVPERKERLVYFTGIDEARFRRPVGPGDVLRLEIDVLQLRPRAAKMQAIAKVGAEVVAEAIIRSHMLDRKEAAR
jgi:3-hydroxyacyl-[acyl-carrier-protein] dehydratase